MSAGYTSDRKGYLEDRAVSLARSTLDVDPGSDEAIANTLVIAVAARNLVSHRHRFLPSRTVMSLGGPCGNAIALIWLLAKRRGLV